MTFRVGGPLALAAVAAAVAASGAGARSDARAACPQPRASAAYVKRVERVAASGRDVWGSRLLAAPDGPTFDGANRYLEPLLYAVGRGGRPLTASGVYYLPFTWPLSVGGPRGFGLHVADGSQILVRRAHGPSLTVGVGAAGRERFGSCLARLAVPQLAEGWLPVLETAYVDGLGVRYAQESFVGRLPHETSIVSFVHVAADAGGASAAARIRLASSPGGLLQQAVAPGAGADLYAAFVHTGARVVPIDKPTYDAALAKVTARWEAMVGSGATYEVPEPRVMAAERALLVQDLAMTWRYSVGNPYEELSFAEALDVARVLASYGQPDAARQILRYTLRQLPSRFTNWRAGERLVAGAAYFRLTGDSDYLAEETPRLGRIVALLSRRIAKHGILPRERYSSDVAVKVYSLAGQTLVWEGLLAMGRVWSETGRPQLAERSRRAAVRLERALRRTVRRSEHTLSDGSVFVPVALLDGRKPYRRVTETRAGSYWNLVAPFALASGFFPRDGREANGLLRYLLGHGSRLLGLVRSAGYRLGTGERGRTAATDQVYGLNVSRFLADEDEPDQLVLSLYGTLAAALTPGTYVSGEAASLAPVRGTRYRAMYLPPSNAGGAVFLETLRLLLVHETRGPNGRPQGLELAFATPRAWLAPGNAITVHDAPTSFGPLAYSIVRDGDAVHVEIDPPAAPAPATLRLRLRLPRGEHLVAVAIGGAPVPFDAASGTIDLSGRSGPLQLDAQVAAAASR